MKDTYMVFGWLNGVDYDAGKPASVRTKVTTEDASKVEDIADKRFKRDIGTCDVVESQGLYEKKK